MNCDKETGTCRLDDSFSTKEKNVGEINLTEKTKVLYFGDPMCSWCWGGSETFTLLEKLCAEYQFDFNIITGGLRAGGGAPWNEEFRSFLKNEWSHISEVTGQVFSGKLLERDYFEYDTEPACRAVNAAAQLIAPSQIYAFFKSVQRKFYVEGGDPKEITFYKTICEEHSIPFGDFIGVFNDVKTHGATLEQFRLCRQLGVRSFPTVCFEYKGKIHSFLNGYVAPEKVSELFKERILALTTRG